MSNIPMEIPNSCYECKLVQSCKALPRWGTKELFNEYRNRRHADCPYNAFVKLAHELYGEREDE